MTADTATKPKKKSLLSSLRIKKKDKSLKGSKKSKSKVEFEDEKPTPPPSPEPERAPPRPEEDEEEIPEPQEKSAKKSVTKDGIPVVTGDNPDDFVPSDVVKTTPEGPVVSKSMKRGPRRGTMVLNSAPTARESAYKGPPRYDWIDVETAAAVKVQAAYRRNKAMDELEAQGVSTTAMRNRARRRQAHRNLQASEDTPSLFQCCGLGLAFGDGTEEDEEAERIREKERYEEKKRQKAAREEKLRSYRAKKKSSDHVMEALEVVEEDDDDDDM